MSRCYYSDSINVFLRKEANAIFGEIAKSNEFPLDDHQKLSWLTQINLLKDSLKNTTGSILFEFTIPRMGRRVDCILLSYGCVFVIEFKVGSNQFLSSAIDQVTDYALDLKNFHEGSHSKKIIPILIATEAKNDKIEIEFNNDLVAKPVLINSGNLTSVITLIKTKHSDTEIPLSNWVNSRYKPTPTIIEAAQALYKGHGIEDISRSDSGAINLSKTAKAIHKIINSAKKTSSKVICGNL